jgi:hypothetical protein
MPLFFQCLANWMHMLCSYETETPTPLPMQLICPGNYTAAPPTAELVIHPRHAISLRLTNAVAVPLDKP